jgi:Ca-activated chloride channel family protein
MLNGSAGTANGGGTSTPAYLVLMTDGEPTVGETTTAKLLDAVKSKRDIRVFDFGVGYDVNTLLLNKLASEHHGTSEYVEKDENLETALASFYQKIKSPVLSNVKIAYDGIEVKDVYPREVKDIFAGSQVMLIGKYKGAGNATVRLTGAVNGVQKAYSFPVSFAAEQSGNTYLPRLWAMRRIGHLTDVAQENGNSREVVDEIVALSKKYGIISQYTSFLVTEPNDRVANSPMPVPVAMGVGVRTSEFRSVPRSNRDMHKSSPIGSPRALAPSSPASADGFVFTLGDAERGASFGGASNSRRERAGWYAPPREAQIIDERPMVGNVAQVSGKIAVKNAIANNKFKDSANLALNTSNAHMKAIEDKTFYLINGYWTDSAYTGKESLTNISFGSKEYFDLVKSNPGIAKFLAVGRQVIIMYNGRGYRITFNMTT